MTKDELRRLIADNRLKEAIEVLLTATKDTTYNSEAVIQSSNYHQYEKMTGIGISSAAELEQMRARVAYGLDLITEKIPDALLEPIAVPAPAAAPNSSKPVTGKPDSDKPAGTLSAKWPFLFSACVLLALIALSVFVPHWLQDNNNLSSVLLGLAAAGATATLPGFLNLDWNIGIKAGGSLAVFVLVFLLTHKADEDEFDLSVYLRPPAGLESGVPGSRVTLDMKDFPYNRMEPVNARGEAQFRSLLPKYRGQPATIEVKSKYLRTSLKEYTIPKNNKLFVDLLPDHLDKVWGTARADGQFLPGVRVRIGDHTTQTDADGRFSFSIPPAEQDTVLTLVAQKEGYVSLNNTAIYEVQVTPYTLEGDGLPVVLVKKKK